MAYVNGPKACSTCGEIFECRLKLCRHKKTCISAPPAGLVEQLREENARLVEQLKTKDEQIAELIKRASTTHNNTHTTTNKWTVDASVHVFGKEEHEHITPRQIEALLTDPTNAVSELIKLKHKRKRANDNVRCPNLKRAMYQVVVTGEDGEKQWENKARGEVLEQLYDANSGHLEEEADEDTKVGAMFMNHQEKVRASESGQDGGRRYKEQLDKIHCVITSG